MPSGTGPLASVQILFPKFTVGSFYLMCIFIVDFLWTEMRY